MPRGLGWNHDFIQAIRSLPRLHRADLTSLAELDSSQDNVTCVTREGFIRSTCSLRSFPHIFQMFPSGRSSQSFGQFLGQIPLENARIDIFPGNLIGVSLLRSSNRRCPFCSAKLYSSHFFDCWSFPWGSKESFSWGDFVQYFILEALREAVNHLFCVLGRWEDVAQNFWAGFWDKVDYYIQELQTIRTGPVVAPYLFQGS